MTILVRIPMREVTMGNNFLLLNAMRSSQPPGKTLIAFPPYLPAFFLLGALSNRFQSPAIGLLASIFLLIFLLFNLVGQFKAGGLIMKQACSGISESVPYQTLRNGTANTLKAVHAWDETSAATTVGIHDLEYPDYV